MTEHVDHSGTQTPLGQQFVLISGVSSFEGFVCLCQNNFTAATTGFAAED